MSAKERFLVSKETWKNVYDQVTNYNQMETSTRMHLLTLYVSITAFSFLAYEKIDNQVALGTILFSVSLAIVLISINNRTWRDTFKYCVKVAQRGMSGKEFASTKDVVDVAAYFKENKWYEYLITSDTLSMLIVVFLSSIHLYYAFGNRLECTLIVTAVYLATALGYMYKRLYHFRKSRRNGELPYLINFWGEKETENK